VPLVAAAVCPHPPLLVPDVAAGAAAELDSLRAACMASVDVLRAAAPDLLVVVGTGATTREHPAGARGTFAGFGVPLEVVLGADNGAGDRPPPSLPLSLTVGAWLLAAAAYDGAVVGLEVAADGTPGERAALGADVAARQERVALLVMGDASARRTPKAPGARDERAEPFDRAVADAFRRADAGALRDLDVALADELMVAGWPAWQVLAGAVGTASDGWAGEVTYDEAPYGVGYVVADWLPT